MPNPAAVAYEAYRKFLHENGTASSVYLLSWEYLTDLDKKAWWEVVKALINYKESL